MKKLIYTLAAIGLTAGAAHAQEGAEQAPLPDTEAAPAPADEAQPAGEPDAGVTAEAAAAASASYTDAEIDSFAQAAVKVREINADASLDDGQKQAEMAAAVTEAGLDPQKYNEIAQAASADAELRARVQLAVARHAQHDEG